MLQVSDLSLHFGDTVLFDSINLTIQRTEKIGLIGRNGAGKTTLLKILSSELRPDSGEVQKASDFTIGYLPQHIQISDTASPFEQARKAIPLLDDLLTRISALENDLHSVSDDEELMRMSEELAECHEEMRVHGLHSWEENVARVLKGLGFTEETMHQSTATLSGGWKMRVELAKILLQSPDLLLLDEPTNHLDIHAIIWLENFLVDYPGAVILISHDKIFLDRVTKRTILIENANVLDFPYPYTRALEEKAQQAEIQAAAYASQQKRIAQKERLIERFRAKASKAKFAKALRKEIDRIDRVNAPEEETGTVKISFPQAGREGAVVAKFEKAVKRYGTNTVISGLDLSIERGERLGVVGQNGEGKTTMIKLLTKEEPLSEGNIDFGHNLAMAYYPQNAAERLDGELTVLETMETASPEEMRTKLRGILGAFLFQNDDVEKKVKVLSGGERSRLALARLLLNPSNVLILDEPTHHLDIPSKEILKQALQNYGGTLIVVSHDRDFLKGLVHTVVAFRNGEVKKFIGGIEEYLGSVALEDMRQVEMRSNDHQETEPTVLHSPAGHTLSFEEKKQLKRTIQQMERRIEKLDEEKRILEQEMMDEAFYQRHDQGKIIEQYDQCCKSLREAEADWEELMEHFEE